MVNGAGDKNPGGIAADRSKVVLCILLSLLVACSDPQETEQPEQPVDLQQEAKAVVVVDPEVELQDEQPVESLTSLDDMLPEQLGVLVAPLVRRSGRHDGTAHHQDHGGFGWSAILLSRWQTTWSECRTSRASAARVECRAEPRAGPGRDRADAGQPGPLSRR